MNEKRGAECDLADKLALADQRRRDMEVGFILGFIKEGFCHLDFTEKTK